MTTDRCRSNGPNLPRTVPGRHDQDCRDPEACPGCQPCEAPHCVVCNHHHVDQLTCPGCISSARDDLHEIQQLCRELRPHAASGGRDGRLEVARPIPGGDAMVLISPGSLGQAVPWAAERGRLRLQAGYTSPGPYGDATHRHDESLADPVPPLLTLATCEDDWRRTIGHEPSDTTPTIGTTVEYLTKNLDYAAQHHDDFPGFVTEIRSCRAMLENTLHAGDRDDHAGVRCFDCGGQLVRKMLKTGLDDHWTCRRCHRRYTDPEYHLAVRARIEAQASA